MNDDEARRMATRMIDTWPNGPKGYIWQNELASLDVLIAGAAYARLRKETDRATTAQFHAAYQSIRNRQAVEHVPINCELCDGTGWITVSDVELGNPKSYSEVAPCRCTAGQQATPVHAAILEHNQRGRP